MATPTLDMLLEEYERARQIFEIRSKAFTASVAEVMNLNKLIYERCQAEGIDINSLNLNGKEAPEEKG